MVLQDIQSIETTDHTQKKLLILSSIVSGTREKDLTKRRNPVKYAFSV